MVTVLALVATASAYASTTPTRLNRASRVLDRTYTCRVRPERYIDIDTNVTISNSTNPELGQVWLDTAHKTAPVGGLQAVVPQVRFGDAKNSLSVDNSLCRPSSRRIPLKPAGLPLYETATPQRNGRIETRCATAKRVLVHFRITLSSGKPEHALFAVRNDDAGNRPVEFVKWSPRRISGYLGKACTDTS